MDTNINKMSDQFRIEGIYIKEEPDEDEVILSSHSKSTGICKDGMGVISNNKNCDLEELDNAVKNSKEMELSSNVNFWPASPSSDNNIQPSDHPMQDIPSTSGNKKITASDQERCIDMEVKRIKISALLRAGHNKSNIAKQLNVSRMTVHRVAERLKNGEDLKDRPRSGRPQVINRLDVRKAFKSVPKLKMTALAKKKNISVATVSRAIRDEGSKSLRMKNASQLRIGGSFGFDAAHSFVSFQSINDQVLNIKYGPVYSAKSHLEPGDESSSSSGLDSYEEFSDDTDYLLISTSDSSTSDNEPQPEKNSTIHKINPDEEQTSQNSLDPIDLPNWKKVNASVRSFPFLGKEDLCVKITSSFDGRLWPIDVYRQFLNDDLIHMMVSQTNRYAEKQINKDALTKKSRLNNWIPTTFEEMKRFFGITLFMGLLPLPDISQFWSKSKLYAGNYVCNIMGRDRYQVLLRMINFSDRTSPEPEKHWKIAPLMEKLLVQFRSVYSPGEDLVINETFPFQSRVGFKQYLQGKRHKDGFKLFNLCTPDGYTLNFQLYFNKSDSSQRLDLADSEVINLMEPFLDVGATLFTDSFYTSVSLGEKLLSRKTYLCGIIRNNHRELPRLITSTKLKRGEIFSLENEKGVKIFNWKNRRNVLSLSTIPEHDDTLCFYRQPSKHRMDKKKPQSVLAFNIAKNGVSVSEHMSAYYTCLKNTRKWYKRVAMELLTGTCVTNAWVIFNKYYVDSKWSMLKFRESLVLSLLNGAPIETSKPVKLSNPIARSVQHFIVEAEGSKKSTRKRCRGCYESISKKESSKMASKKAKRVSTYCDTCKGNPYLCLPCFRTKHKN